MQYSIGYWTGVIVGGLGGISAMFLLVLVIGVPLGILSSWSIKVPRVDVERLEAQEPDFTTLDTINDVVDCLIGLGYTRKRAEARASKIVTENPKVTDWQQLLELALRD